MLPSLLGHQKRTYKYPTLVDNHRELSADLGLDAVLRAMAGDSPALREAARSILYESPAAGPEDIRCRQDIMKDALINSDAFTELYQTLSAGLTQYEDTRRLNKPGYALYTPMTERTRSAAELLTLLLALAGSVSAHLRRMKPGFASQGLIDYARAFLDFYADDFIAGALKQGAAISRISEGSCLSVGAMLGLGLKGTAFVLRSAEQPRPLKSASRQHQTPVRLDTIALQHKAMELRDAALSRVLRIASAAIDQAYEDLKSLLYELSFYVGCIRLHRIMADIGVPVCFPSLAADMDAGDALAASDAAPCPAPDALSFGGLIDISLPLNHRILPIANAVDLDGMRLTLVTGANQGGKSTFLRSVGCAQLMAQCGMFVAARDFHFSIRSRVFTHFCKPEDTSLDSGKLDEELARLNLIVDRLSPRALVLMNESFSSTAEREAAAIAREVVGALYDLNVKVVFVTHLYEYAHAMGNSRQADVSLLRAERCDDGSRTFRVLPGLSLPTSYGMDLFREIIGGGVY